MPAQSPSLGQFSCYDQLASVLAWSGTYRQLFTRVIFTEWIFFAMMAGGIFLRRRRPDYAPAYRVWGYPWVPAVFVVASVTIVVNRLISEPLDSAAGLAIVALGVPAYLLWSRRQPPPPAPSPRLQSPAPVPGPSSRPLARAPSPDRA